MIIDKIITIVLCVSISLALIGSIVAVVNYYMTVQSSSHEEVDIFKNAETIPESSDDSVNTILADVLNTFSLASYENSDGYDKLDDSYLGVYKRANIDLVTDFSKTASVGSRIAVWVNVDNNQRVIGIYDNNGIYRFRIGEEEDDETYGLRLKQSVQSEVVTSSNIVLYTDSWNRSSNATNVASIIFTEV